jgi:hypothetical protein
MDGVKKFLSLTLIYFLVFIIFHDHITSIMTLKFPDMVQVDEEVMLATWTFYPLAP